MSPKKEVGFPGVFIKNHRSLLVTLEFPPTNKGRVSTWSGKSGNLEDHGKVRGENVIS